MERYNYNNAEEIFKTLGYNNIADISNTNYEPGISYSSLPNLKN